MLVACFVHLIYLYIYYTFIIHLRIYNALTFSTYIFIQTPATRASTPPRQICHICRRQMSLPISIYGEGVAERPGVRSASIPPRKINNARNAGVHSPSQNQQRPQRGRQFPLACHKRPQRGRQFPLAKSTTPATRASIPPRKINNARNAGVHSPSQNQQRPQRGRPLPLAIYGEGGGRQARGEVRGQAVRSKTRF